MAYQYTYRFNVVENISGASRKINRSFDHMNRGATGFARNVSKTAGPLAGVKNMVRGLGPAVAGAFAVDRVMSFGRSVVDTLATFERYEAVLKNALGSESAAQQSLREITDFATKTPFQVDELTDSFVKLVNRGFQPTRDEMTAIGDLAASQGKRFDQLVEAILDAETGEFERLKEFGIRAKKEGDQVAISFKGVNQVVKDSPREIRRALLALRDEAPGVAGSMEEISKTTGGMLSNLSDQWTQLKLSIGEAVAPILAEWLPKMTMGVQQLGQWINKNKEDITEWANTIINGVTKVFNVFNKAGEWMIKVKNDVTKALNNPLTIGKTKVKNPLSGFGGLAKFRSKAKGEGESENASVGGKNSQIASDLGISKAVNRISGSGSGDKNIRININKLVETMEIKSESMEQSYMKIRDEITRVLLDAVNQANYAN